MAEYIEKWPVVDMLIGLENEFQQYKPFRGFEHAMYRKLCAAEIAIGKAAAADVVPVVHGHWSIRCETHQDTHTGEVDEEFYLECSECRRKVWDVSQDAIIMGDYQKAIEPFPYCHCGARMEG